MGYIEEEVRFRIHPMERSQRHEGDFRQEQQDDREVMDRNAMNPRFIGNSERSIDGQRYRKNCWIKDLRIDKMLTNKPLRGWSLPIAQQEPEAKTFGANLPEVGNAVV